MLIKAAILTISWARILFPASSFAIVFESWICIEVEWLGLPKNWMSHFPVLWLIIGLLIVQAGLCRLALFAVGDNFTESREQFLRIIFFLIVLLIIVIFFIIIIFWIFALVVRGRSLFLLVLDCADIYLRGRIVIVVAWSTPREYTFLELFPTTSQSRVHLDSWSVALGALLRIFLHRTITCPSIAIIVRVIVQACSNSVKLLELLIPRHSLPVGTIFIWVLESTDAAIHIFRLMIFGDPIHALSLSISRLMWSLLRDLDVGTALNPTVALACLCLVTLLLFICISLYFINVIEWEAKFSEL
jgi:hypothetical protein